MVVYTIYQIKCKTVENEYIYVGSTKNFTRRKSGHKYSCNTETNQRHNLLVYTTIRANGGWDNWSMIPIEQIDCNNNLQARIREQYHMDQLQSKLCSQRAYISPEDRADKMRESGAKYNAAHADEIREYNAKYRAEHADQKRECNAKYRAEHADEIREYKRQWYIAKRERDADNAE